MKSKVPQTFIQQNTLVVAFPKTCRVLSWAPLGGGFTSASHWINHQVEPSYKFRRDFPSPEKTLTQVAKKLGLPRSVVGQMTSGDIRRFQKAVFFVKVGRFWR
jgi:adenosylcobinamide amidohydrolase